MTNNHEEACKLAARLEAEPSSTIDDDFGVGIGAIEIHDYFHVPGGDISSGDTTNILDRDPRLRQRPTD
ncbi:MAG: hypothetical protein HKM24_05935 [Gammaproteobacteria bacterium]|nr:hypothetical protein [Gammaproteobacteria bacterium]